ncbi:folate family ECF transporter S component [Clostridium rectalis]|uniref:folate family ECF transporter S component n=1 Tax=Clostridium rectalis TaxID=2040295 RepID=UPI001FAA9C0B|nr:folate family ECF transporter S component [Clostridium rectalis]
MKDTKKMVIVSLLIALQVVLTRFLGIETPIVRISFGFLPLSICAAIFGPVVGAIAAVAADIIGMLVFPKGAYFPGFTLSAALSGFIYGFFLHRKPKSLLSIILAAVCVTLFVNLGLNTLWLSMITKNAVYAVILPRIVKNLVELPIRISMIYISWRAIGMYFNKNFTNISM